MSMGWEEIAKVIHTTCLDNGEPVSMIVARFAAKRVHAALASASPDPKTPLDEWADRYPGEPQALRDALSREVNRLRVELIAAKPLYSRRVLMAALEDIALLDEADGHELTAKHAFEAVAIATKALGKHPSEIVAARAAAPAVAGEIP